MADIIISGVGGGGYVTNYQIAMVGERAVDNAHTCLAGNLNDCLVYISAGIADGVPITEVEQFYKYQVPKAPTNCYLEIYQDSITSIDISPAIVGRRDVRSTIDVTIRLTWINRSQVSPDNVRKIMQRYQAAIVKVFQDNTEIKGDDYECLFTRIKSFDYVDDNIQEAGMQHIVSRITAVLECQLFEFNSIPPDPPEEP